MRDYLYIWHEPNSGFVVMSGIQMGDLLRGLPRISGIVLLSHQYDDAEYDCVSGLDFVPRAGFDRLLAEDVHSWGDYCWVDYKTAELPTIAREDVAELLYFKHAKKPLRGASIASLQNTYLVTGHDDGWFVKLYYTEWGPAFDLLCKIDIVARSDAPELLRDRRQVSLWVDASGAKPEKATFDIDSILATRLG